MALESIHLHFRKVYPLHSAPQVRTSIGALLLLDQLALLEGVLTAQPFAQYGLEHYIPLTWNGCREREICPPTTPTSISLRLSKCQPGRRQNAPAHQGSRCLHCMSILLPRSLRVRGNWATVSGVDRVHFCHTGQSQNLLLSASIGKIWDFCNLDIIPPLYG